MKNDLIPANALQPLAMVLLLLPGACTQQSYTDVTYTPRDAFTTYAMCMQPLILDKKESSLPTDTILEEAKLACRDERKEWVQLERAASQGSAANDSSIRQREQSILDSYRSYLDQR
jgi:hypothetical protein